ncbi:Asp-tRNA(Asn)/Glu-tRNA(Gln) amidotransferase GatCAB subunit A [Candidatus Woesearchaeota archaeon CG10_big_fil_rev_8_21_14_0_10_44_13]|nr:MAG: Asp-tRNA(Asn)/Glu-tRNA(Gln) amidotransferase GatCAB subunit A [Candidatus Woesearchaeota archaeon CG10_big_fil_rev_8_21_14_0_10_44_13]
MRQEEQSKKSSRKEIDIVESTEEALQEAKEINEEYNYLNVISENLALGQARAISKNPNKGRLSGIFVSVKDCLVVKDVESTAGSRILKGYKPVFNATAVQRCIDEGAIIIGKTSQDEFGFGSFSVNVGVDCKIPLNPYDTERACGGSSGGAGGFTRKFSKRHIALGESTGGSIVCPASFCGIVGLCPTYGLVSRYGLMDYANSLDKIGPMAKNVDDAALLLDVISGFDEKDSTSVGKKDFMSGMKKDSKLKVAIIEENFGKGTDEEVKQAVISALDKAGIKYDKVKLPLTAKYGIATYYLISMSEASTNLAKYCGMRYGKHEKLDGNFNEYFTKVRGMHFGKEAKRRIMLGTFARMSGFRDAYYMQAMKVRTRIIEEYKNLFRKYDILVSPTMPFIAPKFSEIQKLTPLQNYMADIMTAGPNLAGLPHMSINAGFSKKEKMPIGIMFIADHFEEGKMLNIGKKVEGSLND